MSLKSMHLLFISLAMMLAAGFAVWNVLAYFSSQESLYLWMGGAAIAAGILLSQYERWLMERLSRW